LAERGLLVQETHVAVIEKLLSTISMPFKTLNRIDCYLWGQGDWKLRPLHQQVIDKLLAYLDHGQSDKIRSQLEQKYFMQFIPEGRINTFFFNNLPDTLLISHPGFQDGLFKIEVFVDGRKQHAQITFYKGRIFSVEFKKPHKFFTGKDIEIGSVTSGQPKNTFTAAIDRAEHGRETDENP
jgi:hypothetical protein